jgi:ABC-2 type transport system ATP-binding protein
MQLLGDPVMELRLATPLNGVAHLLADRITVVDQGQDWLRYTVPDPIQTNPIVLNELARRNVPVVTLSEVPRSLEEIYLRIVGAREGQQASGRAEKEG